MMEAPPSGAAAAEASLGVVYITALVAASLAVFYGWVGLEPAPLISLGIWLGPLIASLVWVTKDAILHRVGLIHDWGFFAWIGWPILLPWYSIKTRGRRGWGFAGLLYLLVVGPQVLYLLVYQIRWGAPPPTGP